MNDLQVIGIITDGDIRRTFAQHGEVAYRTKACDMMSAPPLVIAANAKLEVARQMMKIHQVSALIVQNSNADTIGILKLHDVD